MAVEYRNRIADLKETAAHLDIVHGNRMLWQEDLKSRRNFADTNQDKSAQAVQMLNNFIKEVDNYIKSEKLIKEQIQEMTEAGKETIGNITN